MNLFFVTYINAQQWFIEFPHRVNEDMVFCVGDKSGSYNYSLGYRYDKELDIMCPRALCISQDGSLVSKDAEYEGAEGSFNAAVTAGDDNIFVTAYCTDYIGLDKYEKMWVAILNPDLEVLHENYIDIVEPYVSFGYVAHAVVNDDNEFVVLAKVAKKATDGIMLNCDFVFYRFDMQCKLLSCDYLQNMSYSSEVSDFVFVPNLNCYAVFGRAMNETGVSSVFYVDKEFKLMSCFPIDKPNNYPNYIAPYFISVGKLYDDDSMLMSMQTRNTISDAEYCPLVLKVDYEMNIIDSIMFERYDITDYVSQYNSVAYVDENTIYVSVFEMKDMYGTDDSNAALVYLMNDNIEILGKQSIELDCFMNAMCIQPTFDGGCIVQAYRNEESDKVAVLYKFNVDDFYNDIIAENDTKEIVFECYPNPTSSFLNINIKDKCGEKIMMTIYDISGRRCVDISRVIYDNNVSIDLSTLEKGIYCCSMTDECNKVVTKIFVKE